MQGGRKKEEIFVPRKQQKYKSSSWSSEKSWPAFHQVWFDFTTNCNSEEETVYEIDDLIRLINYERKTWNVVDIRFSLSVRKLLRDVIR